MTTVAGLARRIAKGGPMETLDSAEITLDLGVVGDPRGVRRPGRKGLRQVTLMTLADWDAACRDLGRDLPWHLRRVNVLVDGDLPRETGAVVALGTALVEITGECDPCRRMDEIAPGLRDALRPDWRGGRLARVVAAGIVQVHPSHVTALAA